MEAGVRPGGRQGDPQRGGRRGEEAPPPRVATPNLTALHWTRRSGRVSLLPGDWTQGGIWGLATQRGIRTPGGAANQPRVSHGRRRPDALSRPALPVPPAGILLSGRCYRRGQCSS